MSGVIFVDTETTGTDPDRHEVWEVALIEEEGVEHVYRMKPKRLSEADDMALLVTHFYDRIAMVPAGDFWSREGRDHIAWEVVRLTAGMHLVGAVPSLDATFLRKFLMEQGYRPAWHYHLIDVETLAVGRLYGGATALYTSTTWPPELLTLPWNTHRLSELMGVAPTPDEQRHTALGDARWAKAMYEAVIGTN